MCSRIQTNISSILDISLMSQKIIKALVLLDRKKGHANIAKGLLNALSSRTEVDTCYLKLRKTGSHGSKLFQKMWPFGIHLAKYFLQSQINFKSPGLPNVVIGSGGNMLWPTAALARSYNATSIFCGSKRHLPTGAFDLLLHCDPSKEKSEGSIILPIIPSVTNPIKCREEWALFRDEHAISSSERHFTCLIGGNGGGYVWADKDYYNLANQMLMLSKKHGIKWLITSSRRTAPSAYQIFDKILPRNVIQDDCWVHKNDRRPVMNAYLGGGEVIYVTEDSCSMLHESIACNKAVVSVRPKKGSIDATLLTFLQSAEAKGWIMRCPADNMISEVKDISLHEENIFNSTGELIMKKIDHNMGIQTESKRSQSFQESNPASNSWSGFASR